MIITLTLESSYLSWRPANDLIGYTSDGTLTYISVSLILREVHLIGVLEFIRIKLLLPRDFLNLFVIVGSFTISRNNGLFEISVIEIGA